ncbi:MAG: hypothetical protein WD181_00450 [Solirubrobacterales bacterium]
MQQKSRHLKRLFSFALIAVSVSLTAACGGGGEGDQFSNETPGDYPVEVVDASFEPRQFVAQTYDLVVSARNTGDETIPAMVATIDIPGRISTLAFAVRDPQPELAQPQRPIWVLESTYPKLAGTVGRGGAATSNRRTFSFGELPAGETATMIWRVTAVEPGSYRLGYELSAGLGLDTRAVDASGESPGGFLPVRITDKAVLTKVDEQGNVVPLTPQEELQLKLKEAN